ncbi:retropepsin-like aspartic protease family protein [Mangrovicoccus algicola]|uniref:TIGR02281 family clan AA aspartic protease n=1 Tax=Mangrovicoccus algicola TaxID=2771008 RepID=A0A8J6YUD2_9RHOB|nr:TIGR02281 family clan AA aspartic protease [Mangrovicoccus algicola]MBE3637762.1 TIGR02281 family clan AA aspartic protease [Mangrovicoccus algicola]
MTEDQIAHLARHLLILGVIGGALLLAFRGRMLQALRLGVIWGLLFLAVTLGYALWKDVGNGRMQSQVFTSTGEISVPRGPDGHYHLTMRIDGTPVRFIVDTGATDIVLSREDARRIGIDPDSLAFFGSAQTANGTVQTARIVLGEVQIGEIADRNVPARVNGGDMAGSLLGMRYLESFAAIEIRDGRMTLTR